MADTVALEAYEPVPSLWQLIENYAPRHELQEVKNLLGESLVQQSLELHEEAAVLVEIWRDYRQESSHPPMRPRLPEPPEQREMLKAQIKFFVNSIQEKARQNGRDSSRILTRHNSQVLDYALDRTGSSMSRASSASISSDGRETPMLRTDSRMSARDRSDVSLEDIRATLDNRTNVFQFDDVLQHLRQVLQQEVADLIEDIGLLHRSLEDEVDFRCESRIESEPTLSELREERTNLERELLSMDSSVPAGLRSDSDLSDIAASPTGDVNARISSPLRSANLSATRIPRQAGNLQSPSPDLPAARPQPFRALPDESTGSGGMEQLRLSPNETELRPHQQSLPLDSSSPALRNLLRTTAPSHMTIRTGSRPSHLVHVATIPANALPNQRVPVPPTNPQTRPSSRPSSANRFRQMVLDCRDGK